MAQFKVTQSGAHDRDGKEIPVGTKFQLEEGETLPGALIGKVLRIDDPEEADQSETEAENAAKAAAETANKGK